ncbi:MAG: hypothetical protein JWM90_2340 [Thermoleophilia bacterium]|nr:hypothetical protein [Thermoleophilia bacterium]
MSVGWLPLIVAAVGSYLLKLAGMLLPARVLDDRRVHAIAGAMPIAMLSALVVVELLDAGGRWGADWHVLAGMVAAVGALVLRQGVLVVFVAAVSVTAILRYVS